MLNKVFLALCVCACILGLLAGCSQGAANDAPGDNTEDNNDDNTGENAGDNTGGEPNDEPGEPLLKEIVTTNKNGTTRNTYAYEDSLMVQEIGYNRSGEIGTVVRYEYDGNRMLSRAVTEFYSNGETISTIEIVYTYNEENQKTRECWSIGENQTVFEYRYDAQGRLLYRRQYNPTTNAVFSETNNTYNDAELYYTSVTQSYQPEYTQTQIVYYDEDGLQTKLVNEDGSYIVYLYDTNKNLISETTYDKNNSIQKKTEYEYEDNILVLEAFSDCMNSEYFYTKEYIYD